MRNDSLFNGSHYQTGRYDCTKGCLLYKLAPTFLYYCCKPSCNSLWYVFLSIQSTVLCSVLELYAWLYVLTCLSQSPAVVFQSIRFSFHPSYISQRLSSSNSWSHKLLNESSQYAPVSRWDVHSSSESQLRRWESYSAVNIWVFLAFLFPRTKCLIHSKYTDKQTKEQTESHIGKMSVLFLFF